MKTDLVLIAALLSIALLSGLAAMDVVDPTNMTPKSFQQHVEPEVLP